VNLSSSAKLKEKASAISRDSKIKSETVTSMIAQPLPSHIRESVVDQKLRQGDAVRPVKKEKVATPANTVTPKFGS